MAASTALEPILKVLYPPGSKVDNLVAESSELFRRIKKSTNLGGKVHAYPIMFEDIVASSSYATAWANRTAPLQVEFNLKLPNPYIAPYAIPAQDIKLSKNNATAFVSAIKRYADSARNACINAMSVGLWHTAAGDIGQIHADTNVSTTTLKVADIADIVNFKKGQKLVFAATRTGALRSSTALTVVSVNRVAGTMVLSATPASLSASIAVGDYIFLEGDAQAGGTAKRPYGIPDYIPSTAPTSGDSFAGGVDRSVDPSRLAGVAVDGTSGSIENALIDCLAEIRTQKGRPDVITMHPKQLAALSKQLGSTVMRTEDGGAKSVGTTKVYMVLGTNRVEVVEDEYCPTSKAYFLTLNTWEVLACENVPSPWDESGGVYMLPNPNMASDEVLCAFRADIILACYSPGKNGVVTLPAL